MKYRPISYDVEVIPVNFRYVNYNAPLFIALDEDKRQQYDDQLIQIALNGWKKYYKYTRPWNRFFRNFGWS